MFTDLFHKNTQVSEMYLFDCERVLHCAIVLFTLMTVFHE